MTLFDARTELDSLSLSPPRMPPRCWYRLVKARHLCCILLIERSTIAVDTLDKFLLWQCCIAPMLPNPCSFGWSAMYAVMSICRSTKYVFFSLVCDQTVTSKEYLLFSFNVFSGKFSH